MSQDMVESFIGRLVTDEAFRQRFASDPEKTIGEAMDQGFRLNPCEARALTRLDPRQAEGFADAIDPCLQKADLSGGIS